MTILPRRWRCALRPCFLKEESMKESQRTPPPPVSLDKGHRSHCSDFDCLLPDLTLFLYSAGQENLAHVVVIKK